MTTTVTCAPEISWYNNNKSTQFIDGEIKIYRPQSISIFSEHLPLWLYAIDIATVTSLSVTFATPPSVDSVFTSSISQLLQHHSSRLVGRIKPSNLDLLLVSGTLEYIHSVCSQYPETPCLYFIDSHNRGRHLPSGEYRLYHYKHSKFGGGTTFTFLWGVRGVSAFQLPFSHPRSIGSFINHGEKGFKSSADDSSCCHWSKFLPATRLQQPILFPSNWFDSGFAARSLLSDELCVIFGFPKGLLLAGVADLHHHIVPLDGLRSILGTYLGKLSSTSLSRTASTPFWVPSVPSNGTYLPSIRKVLPDSWRSGSTSEDRRTSAKNDDARPDIDMWNSRITLVLPHIPVRVLDFLRLRLVRRRASRLRREILQMLRLYHPKHYLSSLRRRFLVYYKALATKPLSRIYPVRFRLDTSGGVWSSFFDPPSRPPPVLLPWQDTIRVARDILRGACSVHITAESFTAWENGSSLYFWRWPVSLRRVALVGFPAAVVDTLPTNMPSPKKIKSSEERALMAPKLAKQIRRAYITFVPAKDLASEVKNLTDMFTVPKGLSDVRMIFNGTSGGLTRCLWAPSFWLPMSNSMCRILNFNYEVVDIDLGEMFNNFPLCHFLSLYSGVDLTPVADELSRLIPELLPDKWNLGDRLIGKWLRLWMGLKPSPEWAARFYYFAEELIRGKDDEEDNPLGWQEVKLNLIGQEDFCTYLPNVVKWNSFKKRPAGDLRAFVDDLRVIGFSIEEAWRIARVVASRLQFLGIQDAPRKRRANMDGPWAGTIYKTKNNRITKTVSLDKWNKAKGYLNELNEAYKSSSTPTFSFKSLEKSRGFFCHLGMTFPIVFPYLKGYHLALCQHLPQRDEEGWKVKELEWIGSIEQRVSEGKLTREAADSLLNPSGDVHENPATVTPGPRFKQCLDALNVFFEKDEPPEAVDRSDTINFLVYGFGDASGSGLGATFDMGTHTKYRIGVWGKDSSEESSNWREFQNLVLNLEEEHKLGKLNGALLILATDNQVAERCIYKGNSTSSKLYDLIVRFRKIEMESGAKFIVTHVSGKRMQLQGTDAVSRGSMNVGVSLGKSMLSFCPWAKSPIESNKFLEGWMKEVVGSDLETLSPADWFRRGHDWDGWYLCPDTQLWTPRIKPGKYLWSIPAAAADAAIEQLRIARLKRRDSHHFLLIPMLYTPLWLKQFYKEVDLCFSIPATHTFWDSNQCEKLIFGICLPFAKHRPWRLQRAPKLLQMEREMREVWKTQDVDHKYHVRKLLSQCRKFFFMPADVLWRVLHFLPDSKVSCGKG